MVRGKYYPNQGLSKWAEKMQFLLCVRMGSNLVQRNVGFMYFASFYIFLSVHQVPTHCTRLILRTISCSLQCRYRKNRCPHHSGCSTRHDLQGFEGNRILICNIKNPMGSFPARAKMTCMSGQIFI